VFVQLLLVRVCRNDAIVLIQISHGDSVYHVGICGKLSQPGCEESSLCRLKPGAPADIKKYTFNKMLLESGHMKLVYDIAPPSPSCGNFL